MTLADIRKQPWFDNAAYPFESHFVQTPAGRMHYVDEGQGDVILLVHGTPSWSFEFRAVISALRQTHRCIAPDLVGFGLSERPPDFGYRLADHTAALRAFIEHLGLQRFTLVVHDFGGPVALPLVLDAPQLVQRLVILNSWLWGFGSVDPGFSRQLPVLRSGLMRMLYRHFNLSAKVIVKSAWGTHRPLTRGVHAHYTRMFPDAPSRIGTLGFLRSVVEEGPYQDTLWERRDRLRGIPTLILWGQADGFVKSVNLARWREALPDARVVELPNVGHFPADEAAPEVTAELQRFLVTAPAAQATAR